eukprot:COSAG06_NODE_260_length_18911_cov_107.646236_10_plen_82_part_00
MKAASCTMLYTVYTVFTMYVVQCCTTLYNFAYCDRINRLCHIAYYIVQLLCTFPANLYRAQQTTRPVPIEDATDHHQRPTS